MTTTTSNPRINVTLDREEFLVIRKYADAARVSLSQALLSLALERLGDYEDTLLGNKALRRLKGSSNKKRFTMDDFEEAFDKLSQ
jgi:hypothetical protein